VQDISAELKMRDIETKLTRLQAVHYVHLLESCDSDRESPSCPILDALNEVETKPRSNS
jgi:hypothetical protein